MQVFQCIVCVTCASLSITYLLLQFSLGIPSTNSISLANYRAGFNQCASEITRVVSSLDNTDPTLRTTLLEHLAARCLATKPIDVPQTRVQLPQPVFTNQPILPKLPTPSVTSPVSLPFFPAQLQSSPGVLPAATQFQLTPYPVSSGKVALLFPTLNPLMMEPTSPATKPGLIPVIGKDLSLNSSLTPSSGVVPLGLDTRPFIWKHPIP